MELLLIAAVMVAGIAIAFYRNRRKKTVPVATTFPPVWRTILLSKVVFYQQLDAESRKRFEADIARFLGSVRIVGVDTTVDITDRLLVASSAVIPVFGFPEWDYTFLDEVLLYPGLFDSQYEVDSTSGEYISGMVGTGGTMEGKMILSKPSLHLGFDNTSDKKNVGIHEFIHLLDKEDGTIDGVPTVLNNKMYSLPWLELIRKKTEKIVSGGNDGDDINPYGATNQQEFLAVTGEYFFERPHLLKKNHPELYDVLAKAFNQDTASRLKPEVPVKVKPGRNSPCLCGSGRKYKDCCLG
jgi:Mlc titration factor MtfA (ptsG expression regulator)